MQTGDPSITEQRPRQDRGDDIPSIGRSALLLLVDGNLPQQRDCLTVPVQDESMVGCHHWVVSLPDGLQAPAPWLSASMLPTKETLIDPRLSQCRTM